MQEIDAVTMATKLLVLWVMVRVPTSMLMNTKVVTDALAVLTMIIGRIVPALMKITTLAWQRCDCLQ